MCTAGDVDQDQSQSHPWMFRVMLHVSLTDLVLQLVGGDFAHDASEMIRSAFDSVLPVAETMLQESEKTLKSETPVLVGHNMFLDLCFLHATFFGPLPDTLEEFGRIIHELFPRIIDTKHILTHEDHDMMPTKTLDGAYDEAHTQEVPFDIQHKQPAAVLTLHPVSVHQAGHDSELRSYLCYSFMPRLLTKLPPLKRQQDECRVSQENVETT